MFIALVFVALLQSAGSNHHAGTINIWLIRSRKTQSKIPKSPPAYFFISSSTAEVIALIPVRRVGSGCGSNKLECSDGKGLPDFMAASTLEGSTAPSQNMNAGIL